MTYVTVGTSMGRKSFSMLVNWSTTVILSDMSIDRGWANARNYETGRATAFDGEKQEMAKNVPALRDRGCMEYQRGAMERLFGNAIFINDETTCRTAS